MRTSWFGVTFAWILVAGTLCSACSGDEGPGDARGDARPRDAAGDGSGDDVAGDGTADGMPGDGPVACPDMRVPCNGMCCGAGTSCAGGFCCAETERCGGVCCGPDRRCEGGSCTLNCGMRPRCGSGMTETCCDMGQVCYLEACVSPGATCSDLMRCPDGQYCEPTLMRCLPRAMGAACEYRPPVGMFRPRLRWQWTGDAMSFPTHNQVMMQPVVANLTDDNMDGRIDRNDIPDVVFTTFSGIDYWANGIVRAISGANGARIWPSAADPGYRATPGASIAIAELVASSPGPEVVTCSASSSASNTAGYVLILSARGTLIRSIMNVPCGHSAPAIGDMDNDGTPDIVVRNMAFHADGSILPGFAMATRETTGTSANDFATLADLDGDGTLEIVHGNRAIRVDGTNLWSRPMLTNGYPAVADLNRDRTPEIVVIQPATHSVMALRGLNGMDFWGPIEINRQPATMGPTGGGPPTIADFNGDGSPDVATAGGYNYLVLHGRDGSLLWQVPSRDHSSRVTGSSVFDFEGDGSAEVIYNDEVQLRVMRGTDGTAIFNTCSTSGTLWEYPVIVDVDNDDHADIVVMHNNYGFPSIACTDGSMPGTGIRVFSDMTGTWVRTRRIWNQHTYHVTNIDEDGNVPRAEPANWTTTGLNNFRQNVQPDGLFDAPDVVPLDLAADMSMCSATLGLRVRVVNRGRSGAPAGIPVTFYSGDPMGMHTRIARTMTTRRLLPGESEVVSVSFMIPAGRERDTFNIYVVINDSMDMPLVTLHECRADNNTSVPRPFSCGFPG